MVADEVEGIVPLRQQDPGGSDDAVRADDNLVDSGDGPFSALVPLLEDGHHVVDVEVGVALSPFAALEQRDWIFEHPAVPEHLDERLADAPHLPRRQIAVVEDSRRSARVGAAEEQMIRRKDLGIGWILVQGR